MLFIIGLGLGIVLGVTISLTVDIGYENKRMKQFYKERLALIRKLEDAERDRPEISEK